MNQILKTAVPSEEQKKKWKLDALWMVVAAVVCWICRRIIINILDDATRKMGKEVQEMLGWTPRFFAIMTVACAILVVLDLVSASKKANAKIEVTEEGIRGVSCPRSFLPALAFSNCEFDIKFSDIENIEFVEKDKGVVIHSKNVIHIICVEEAQKIVNLIKDLKFR